MMMMIMIQRIVTRTMMTIPFTEIPNAFYRGSNVSLMITNDLYEGSGSMRRDGPSEYSEVRDRARMQLPGGANTDVHRTAARDSSPRGKTVS